MPKGQDLLLIDDAARELGVTRKTIFEWIRRGWLHPEPVYDLASRRQKTAVPRSEVDKLKAGGIRPARRRV